MTEDAVEDLGPVEFFDGTGRRVRRVQSAVYGDLWAPDDYSQLGVVLDFIASQVDAIAWRGQADLAWRLDSSAVRRLIMSGFDLRDPYRPELDHEPGLSPEATLNEYRAF